MKTKQDQAARIDGPAKIVRMAREVHNGEYWYNDRKIEAAIRRAITTAVRKERERCVKCVADEMRGPAIWRCFKDRCNSIIEKINGGKRGKA